MPLSRALLVLAAAAAVASAEPQTGYVVKVESGSIYFDFNEKAGASAGQGFQVYAEGAELKHPVTGQSLGRVENEVAAGRLVRVAALYSVGELGAGSAGSSEIKPGMRARLLTDRAAPTPAPGSGLAVGADTGKPDGKAERAPRWRSPSFAYPITGMAIGEFRPGKLGTALSDGKKIFLYDYPPASAKPEAELELRGSAVRVLSLDAGDAGEGRVELFATAYNQIFNRVETTVLRLEDGRWKEIAQTPWIVRAIQDPAGKPVLAVQQLVEDNTFPFSSIYPLVGQDGKFGAAKKSIKPKRVDWIYDFTNATFDGAPATLHLTSLGHVRVQFDKGSWKSADAYCQTPVRLRWPDHEGRLLEFHPAMRVAYDAAGKAAVYLPRNRSMLGSLSEPFGLFNGGELERKSWDGVSLVTDWKAELGGYAPAVSIVGPPEHRDVAVAVVGTSGRSMVWIYDP